MSESSPCAICGTPIHAWERYPNLLCVTCAAQARDDRGRPMRFSNETLLGTGFIAEVEDDGIWRRVEGATHDATCWVKGSRCIAREHRFGGIVVQVAEE